MSAGVDSSALASLHEGMLHFAALRGEFRPAEALRAATGGTLPEDDSLVAAALSALQADCTLARDDTGQLWNLRASVRRKVMLQLEPETVAAEAGPLVEALLGSGAYAPESLGAVVERSESDNPPTSIDLTELVTALDRAGPRAPAHNLLAALRGALNSAEQRERAEKLLSAGFFGREKERADLRDWITRPTSTPPVQTLHISGLPGIGKSLLLEYVVHETRRSGSPIVIRLDFDRSGLSVFNSLAFFEEVSRQLGDAVPSEAGALRQSRLDSARYSSALKSRDANYASSYAPLIQMGDIVTSTGRSVLVVLDTLEILRSRGETAVMTLFEHLDRLVENRVAPMSVISAGRGDALDPVPQRVGGRLSLEGLEDAAADLLLAARGVPPPVRPGIRRFALGNPLLLSLAARAGLESLDRIPSESQDSAAAGAYLYRGILSRLPPPLNDLAQAALILRRLDAPLMAAAVAPALGLAPSPDEAVAQFNELATQHWLVEPDGVPGWLRHRSDIRATFLPMLYTDRPDLAAAVNERAAQVLAETAPADALYHRLQLTRAGAAIPTIEPQVASSFTNAMIEELPLPARTALRQARGERSEQVREAADAAESDGADGAVSTDVRAPPDLPSPRNEGAQSGEAGFTPVKAEVPPLAEAFRLDSLGLRLRAAGSLEAGHLDVGGIEELGLTLSSGDLREAGYIVRKALMQPFLATTPGAEAILAYLWLSGRWASAVRLWRAMGRPVEAPSDPTLARILREIDAELRFATAARRVATQPQPPASGRNALLGSAFDVAVVLGEHAPFGERRTAPEGEDRAAALIAPWIKTGAISAVARLRQEAAIRRERLGLTLEFEAVPYSQRHGIAIAPAMPHTAPLATLLLDSGGGEHAAWLSLLRPRLEEIAALQVPWLSGVETALAQIGDRPVDVLDAVAALGLLADAAGAMALALRDGEVATLAASAERWRRVSYGLWSLSGRAPAIWNGRSALDGATAGLTDRLALAPRDAERLFDLWSPVEPKRVLARIASKLKGRLHGPASPERTAALALGRGVPGPLAAAAAALFGRGGNRDPVSLALSFSEKGDF